MATYTGLDGVSGNAFAIVAGGFSITAGGFVLTDGSLDLGQTYVPSSNRDDIGLQIGTRAAELDIAMANSTSQHFEPIQMNMNFTAASGAPTSTSTVNILYMQLTHDTAAMANLRLKGADWTFTLGVNIQDAYVFQGEIDFTGAVTVGGEAAVLGLTMNSGSSTVTGNLWGIVLVTSGSGAGKDAAIFLSHRGGTLTQSIYIECNSGQTITNAIYVNQPGTITNFLKLNIEGFCAYNAGFSGQSNAEPDASIRVIIGGNVLYLYAFPTIVS